MAPVRVLLAFAAAVAVAVAGSIPSYIPVCKRNDPDINNCIKNAVEKLKPKLAEGIPELDVPKLEPLYIPQLTISPNQGQNIRAVGTNVRIHGASHFTITSITADIPKHEFSAAIKIPSLYFEADYDVDAKLLSITLKGRGPLTANATECSGDVVLKGQLVKKNGSPYLYFYNTEVSIDVKHVQVHLEGLFNGDKVLGEATNQALNENSGEFWPTIKPIAEQTIAEVLLGIANNITSHFTYDDLFPKN
ncbi:protein takeout-like [Schistocerca nitens]|uniref:protein takeout-like n=1 Tax=Schistocerca cancellata TaxID=274614 RepID=UPI002118110C|nr:protein takeout-like [Schistocerca cancellata]XP_049802678.1 protein takeout-like [Schistocerca nitens]